eukprot:Nitzschia sp. Nitz4//scaffold66_size103028//90872//91996//NITZ4_004514-RA/size103028-processed-gene-0.16-mRNA-1//1//CDS//3329556398//8899//frame0
MMSMGMFSQGNKFSPRRSRGRRGSRGSRDQNEKEEARAANVPRRRSTPSVATAPIEENQLNESESEYFFPFDDMSTDSTRFKKEQCTPAEAVSPVDNRQKAVRGLEAFFLGQAPPLVEQSSPVSIFEFPSPIPSHQSLNDVASSMSAPIEAAETQGGNTSLSLQPPQEEELSISNNFVMLQKGDRAFSLPIESTFDKSNSSDLGRPISKRPSLKRMSTIGQGMPKNVQSDGNLQRTVSFSSLSIREYPPALSDNPSCSFGPPIQLGWEHEAEETLHIDHYEETRQPRRESHDLVLSYYDRRYLLLKQAGYSRREVKETMKEVERVKRERMVTDLFLPVHMLDETVEAVVNSFKRLFQPGDNPSSENPETSTTGS